MSAQPEVLARLDAWLSDECVIEDKLAQLRDLLCDVVNAGDDLHSSTEALSKHAPRGFVLDLEQYREAWRIVGGQSAIDKFDNIARDITDALGVAL